MADKDNCVRLTRAAKKRVASVAKLGYAEDQPLTKKRVVLGELPNLSNAVVVPANKSLKAEPQKPKGKANAKPKVKKALEQKKTTTANKEGVEAKVDDNFASDDPQMCEPYVTDIYDYLRNMEINRAKILLSQDNKYIKGFKFDHAWPIRKDMQKFTDNDIASSAFRRQSSHFVSSQEDSPTPKFPTTASLGLFSLSLNMTSDDVGDSSSQQLVRVKKAKLKRKADEESSKIINTLKEGQQELMEVFKRNSQERQRTYDIMERKMDLDEIKIVMMDLNTITDLNRREFIHHEQLRIMAKRA